MRSRHGTETKAEVGTGPEDWNCQSQASSLLGRVDCAATPGTRSIRIRSMPALRVIIDIGQPPQAPTICRLTVPSSTPSSTRSPPSIWMAGRMYSSVSWRTARSTSWQAHQNRVSGIGPRRRLARRLLALSSTLISDMSKYNVPRPRGHSQNSELMAGPNPVASGIPDDRQRNKVSAPRGVGRDPDPEHASRIEGPFEQVLQGNSKSPASTSPRSMPPTRSGLTSGRSAT